MYQSPSSAACNPLGFGPGETNIWMGSATLCAMVLFLCCVWFVCVVYSDETLVSDSGSLMNESSNSVQMPVPCGGRA